MSVSPTQLVLGQRGPGVLAFVLLASAAAAQQQPPRFTERVNVSRIMVDARVIDGRGDPVLGLTAEDFAVAIDGKAARVETATWVGGLDTSSEPAGQRWTHDASLMHAGRLIVFLVQKDLEPSRIVGLMRMLLEGRDFLGTLTPADRVAILSFDSHLKIWTDFTNDRGALDRVLARGVLFERARAVPASSEPSLVQRLAFSRAKRTYSIERALELIAGALEPLPGAKSLVLIGHGFGRLGLGGVIIDDRYAEARRALIASRTSVFSLDVTQADYHSLEAGLQVVARDTGGFFERTHIWPDAAMRRLSGALAGYYVLFVEAAEDTREVHEVRVKLTRRQGRVLASTSYTDRWR